MSKILETVAVNKSYGAESVIKNINIGIENASISFLVGPSGSGKTTLLKCLAGIENINSGIIKYKKEIIRDDNLSKYGSIYPQITAVTQGYTLWPHLTNLENILLSKYTIQRNMIDHYAYNLNITSILNKYPYQCSGGEQQRVALLRHIALEPKVLLLDEITSALDVEQIDDLAKVLVSLKAKGTAIVIVSHLLSFVSKIGDYFYFMDDGTIVEHGRAVNFNNPKTERLKSFLSVYSI